MPFTLAHIVIASPISKITQNKLPIAALAIGCMTPDLFRLLSNSNGLESHAWTAIFYPNLILGFLFCALWYSLFRPTLYSCLALQDELNISNIFSFFNFFCFSCLALLLGNATHILWDGLTHLDSRTLLSLAFLEQKFILFNQEYSAHFILQILSSILPLPFIVLMISRYYKKHYQPHLKRKNHLNFLYICLLISFCIGMIGLSFYAVNIQHISWINHQYYFIGRMLNKFNLAFLLSFSFCCILYQCIFSKKMY